MSVSLFALRRRSWSAGGLLALAAFAGCRTAGPVRPAPDLRVAAADLRCHLSVLEPEIVAGRPVVVRMEIENVGSRSIWFHPDGTAMQGRSFVDSFRVIGPDGARLKYIGLVAKRGGGGANGWCGFIAAPPGTRRGGTADLAQDYEFRGPGEYRVGWNGLLGAFAVAAPMPAAPPAGGLGVPMTCPEVTLRLVPPRPAARGP